MEKVIVSEASTLVKMSPDEAKDVCKLGQLEKCCAFLAVSAESFECLQKIPSVSDNILSRLAKGTINTKGLGGWEGCAWSCLDRTLYPNG